MAAVSLAGRPRGQLRIQNHDAGHHLQVKNRPLDVIHIVGDHHRLAHLRAGTCRSRHRDDREHLAGINGAGAGFEDTAALVRNQRNGLGRINGRAATKGNHAVMFAGFQRRHTVSHIAACGVTLDGAEQANTQASIAAVLQGLFNHGETRQTGIGDQQRRLHSQLAAGLAQFTDAPCTHAHRRGVVPVHAERGDFHANSNTIYE